MEEKKKTGDNIPLSAKTDMEAYIRSAGHGGTGAAMPQGIGNRYFMLWIIVAFFAGMLVSLGSIWCWQTFWGGEKAAEEQPEFNRQEVVVDSNVGESGGAAAVDATDPNQLTAEQAADFFNRANAALAKPELTFAQIEALYAEFGNMQPKMSQEIATGNSENIARLNLYNKIAKAFKVAEDASIEMLMRYAANDISMHDKGLLAKSHYSALRYLLWARNGGKYLSLFERGRVSQYLKEHAHEYSSFSQLPTYDKIFPSADKSNSRDKEKQEVDKRKQKQKKSANER